MTTAELKRRIQDAQDNFYAWAPDNPKPGNFRCWHIQPYSITDEIRCQARAAKPEIYREAGCGNGCPRWKHYRKLAKKAKKEAEDHIVRRAYR